MITKRELYCYKFWRTKGSGRIIDQRWSKTPQAMVRGHVRRAQSPPLRYLQPEIRNTGSAPLNFEKRQQCAYLLANRVCDGLYVTRQLLEGMVSIIRPNTCTTRYAQWE